MDLIYEDVDTPIGSFRVAEREGRVCAAAFGDGWSNVAARVERRLGPISWKRGETTSAPALAAYFRGELNALDRIEVDAAGSPFQASIWSRLRDIHPGTTVSYSELASAVGSPRASRAVGSANAVNPLCLIVPCHRVVRADGTPGGYAGGPERKDWLLRHESGA